MGDAAALLLSSASRSILVFVLAVLIVPQVLLCEGDDDVGYTECRRSFNCRTVTDITYPFWGDGRPQFCGLEGFKVECYEDKYPILEYQEQKYRVLKIDQHVRTMTIARMDLMDSTCLREFRNTSIMDSTLFHMTPAVKSLSIFYGCYGTLKNVSNEFECLYDGSRKSAFFIDGIFLNREIPFDVTTCNTSIMVPVLQSSLDDIGGGNISLQEALNRGFDVQYSEQPECSACTSSGGLCGSNSSPPSNFTCYCRDKPHARTCNHPDALQTLSCLFLQSPASSFQSQMNLHSFLCLASCRQFVLLVVVFVVVLANLVYRAASEDAQYEACEPRSCGHGPNISYPFWISSEQESYCGYPNFEINCTKRYPVLKFSDGEFIIKDIFYPNHSILLVNAFEYQDSCGAPPRNISLERTPFNLCSSNTDFFFYYNCTSQPTGFKYPVDCASNSTHHSFAFFPMEPMEESEYYSAVSSCDPPVSVPVDVVDADIISLGAMNYSEVVKMGFLLNWTAINCSNCERSGGRCGFENNTFVCFCRDGPHSRTCKDGNKNIPLKVGLAVGGVACGIAVMVIVYLIHKSRQRKKSEQPFFVSRSLSSADSSRTDFEQGGVYYGIPVFNYEELQKATNNFDPAEELGDGGFGTVFKGKLQDGRIVAVKRLYESNYKRVEQFMNEVVILTRLRHPNLVSLYGCTSRQSQRLLLVYEYVPNGTVADHIHGEQAKPGLPPWSTRLNIAIETANALVYLHASDVIHRDVKTNNILLGENFKVKVADFGLSRLFPLDVTHVSTAPQGTPGYVDPEYHQCYQLTEKSDVYSFGVVLMELISSLPAVDITRHRHEINLSALAMNKIQCHTLHELVDRNLGFDTDYRTRKMITAVAELGFRCLHQCHDVRPSMIEVWETLKDIKNCSHDMEKSEKMDNLAEDAVLLKTNPLTLSPDSVTVKWVSTDTPLTSG